LSAGRDVLITLGVFTETVAGATYIVTTQGDNGLSGTSEAIAWATVAFAAAQATAGDTVYIQAGDYGNEIRNSTITGYATCEDHNGGSGNVYLCGNTWSGNGFPAGCGSGGGDCAVVPVPALTPPALIVLLLLFAASAIAMRRKHRRRAPEW
jgi:hypothetical protein